MTRVLRVDPERPDAAAIGQAVAILRAGGLVAFPTETVYGLGGRALDASSARRIFAAKGRPSTHALIAHVLGEADARRLTTTFSPASSTLASRFWPGPLTLVLDRAPIVPREVSGGGDTIAVRATLHPVARALIEALGEPIAAPSANRYQTLSPTTAAHVVKSLGDAVDLVLDGGPCDRGIESTVIDARGDDVVVLRPGAIDLAQLRAAVPPGARVVLASPKSHEGKGHEGSAPRPSPGTDARHYAPRARLEIVRGAEESAARVTALTRAGTRVGLVPLGNKGSVAYEAELFATLHDFDDQGCAVIVVEEPPDDDAWLAVRDRLRRASAP